MVPYNAIIDTLPETEGRLEVLFRQAGDGFLQVEYGREQRAHLIDSFRVQTVNDLVLQKKIEGLYETVPGIRTNLFHFDPTRLSVSRLIEEIAELENDLKSVEHVKVSSRRIKLPLAFEDSETKKCIEKYVKEVRPGAPNVINGYTIEYIALCNGITVNEVKRMILSTDWYNSGGGFWPGGAFFWPMDPRCAIVVPKFNPPRTWTPEGAVGIGGPCVFTYTTPTGGGYQLFGRTIPTFQFAMKHPLFKDSPFLYRPADRVRFHEVSEDEVKEVYRHVHEETDYKYEIEEGVVSAKEWFDFYNSDVVQKEAAELIEKQKVGTEKAPKL